MSSFTLKLAILPSLLLLMFVVGRNKKRRNPTSLLVWLAVLGAVSAIPAVIVEILGEGILYVMGLEAGSSLYVFIECFCIIAMIEELGKFLGMLLLTWKNKNFDHSYDGVIYGVCSSLGFATLENILYVFNGGIGIGVMRAFSAVPLHCACGVIMGFFYAKAREKANNKDGSGVFANLVLSYICPLGLHGLYDFVLSLEDSSLLVSLAVIALSIALLFLMISHAAKEDHIITVQPIWTDPYSFRYMPMRGYGRPNNYGKQGGYSQPNSYYGQPNGYNQQVNYSQPNNYYGQANYGQPNGYSQQVNYSQSNNYYGQANYGQQNGYNQQANYSQPNGYNQSYGYGQQNIYDPRTAARPNDYNQPR